MEPTQDGTPKCSLMLLNLNARNEAIQKESPLPKRRRLFCWAPVSRSEIGQLAADGASLATRLLRAGGPASFRRSQVLLHGQSLRFLKRLALHWFRSGTGRVKARPQPPRFVRSGAEENEAHFVGGLLAKDHLPGRATRIVRISLAIVVKGFHLEARARLHMDGLFEHVSLLPVVIPILNRHQGLLGPVGLRRLRFPGPSFCIFVPPTRTFKLGRIVLSTCLPGE